MFEKAKKYLDNNRAEKALPLLKKIVRDGGDYKEVWANMGTAYRMLGDDHKAYDCLLKAADPLTPFTDNKFAQVYPIALNNLSLLAYTYENDDVAAELLHQALTEDPLYYDAIWNLANVRFRQYLSGKYDDLEKCFKLYEYRYKRAASPVMLKTKGKFIQWNGEPGVNLAILTEQGFGDQLMFGRYLKLAKNISNKLVVQCHDRMKAIYEPEYQTCIDPGDLSEFTHAIGICSLGRIFNEIPPGDWLNEKYIPKHKNAKLDIGVTWSGNPDHVNDKYRSTTPNYFRDLANFGDLYTLNPTESGTRGFTALKSGNWGETISELSKLDLVITVDTSIVHLCGSLGMPCWLVLALKNNDFRWGDSSCGYSNKWYPSVKVFRNKGSWEEVFERVKNELKDLRDSIR